MQIKQLRGRPGAAEEPAKEGVLFLPRGLLLRGALATLVLWDPRKHLVDVLSAPGPRRLLTPLARHLSTHPMDYTPGGI